MKIEHIEVYGWRAALRGLRNPMDSWDKSDTTWGTVLHYKDGNLVVCQSGHSDVVCPEVPVIGPEDMKLLMTLIKRGGDERKVLRLIQVWWDITIPRYLWQELDTYKIGTVRMSCSSMNKLWNRDLASSDFQSGEVNQVALDGINQWAGIYRSQQPRDPDLLAHIKRLLPEGFLQKATYGFNYEVALRMYHARKNHRMPEWSGPGGICDHLLKLPYLKEFVDA
jgi:hypothetical protein